MSKLYQAWGYIGVIELAFYGNFHSRERAHQELSNVLERQINEGYISKEDIESETELFWANSQIREVNIMERKPEFEKLSEVFETNSLKSLKTEKQQPQPTTEKICYIWNEIKTGLIAEILERGKVFKPGIYSINNYIELTDRAYEMLENRVITLGPGSRNKTQTVRVIQLNNDVIRIIGSGWGSSFVVFWEGENKHFLQYLLDHQRGNSDN